jgi:hypothetical protein
MYQYHHLGDAATITDGLIYNPSLKPYETDGLTSGTRDDRVAFTGNFSAAGTMSAVASLASAARVLKPYYPEVAERALRNAVMLWEKYSEDADPSKINNPMMRRFGGDGRVNASIELWRTTGDKSYVNSSKRLFSSNLNPLR